jgi:aminopeptidase N
MTTWQDLWLKEGSTTYAQWLWEEQKSGPDVLDLRVRQTYAQEAIRKFAPGNPDPRNLYNDSVYDRGALTFHALRMLVGDETFFEILQTFTQTYRHSNASTADFVAVGESVSGLELEEFFNGWLYQEEIPAIPEMDLSP